MKLLIEWLQIMGLILCAVGAWLAVAYVCSRKVVWFESDWDFLRMLMPGIF